MGDVDRAYASACCRTKPTSPGLRKLAVLRINRSHETGIDTSPRNLMALGQRHRRVAGSVSQARSGGISA